MRKPLTSCIAAALLSVTSLQGAELSVGDVTMPPGTTGDVVVSGAITNEVSYGLTIMVEIVGRTCGADLASLGLASSIDGSRGRRNEVLVLAFGGLLLAGKLLMAWRSGTGGSGSTRGS